MSTAPPHSLTDALRAARPDIALSTDLITGFPGESEEDFLRTLELMRRCGFMASFSFCYSDRPGTRASRFLDKVPDETRRERLLRLQALQEELGRAWLDGRVGRETDVLIEGGSPREGAEGGTWQGRDPYGAVVHVAPPPEAAGEDMTGRMVRARITGAGKHSLRGRQVGASW